MASATDFPLRRIPSLRSRGDDAVDSGEHERRELVEASRLHERSVGIAERKEPVGVRAEEGMCVSGIRCDDQIDPGVGPTELLEHTGCGLEHPRALVGVRIEHDGGEMERGEPLHDRAPLTCRTVDQRRQDEVGRELFAQA